MVPSSKWLTTTRSLAHSLKQFLARRVPVAVSLSAAEASREWKHRISRVSVLRGCGGKAFSPDTLDFNLLRTGGTLVVLSTYHRGTKQPAGGSTTRVLVQAETRRRLKDARAGREARFR